MRLAIKTWTEVESYLKTNQTLIIPIGSTEQHGPTGCIGTDHLTADAIAREVGKRAGVMVAPPICYGMAAHHMSFAGSASLKPSTYQLVMMEILQSFYHHGFRNFHLVNGHGGNEHSVRAVFQELKALGAEGASYSLHNWWRLPEVSELARELYGEREGFHATPSEVSVTLFIEKLEPLAYKPIAESNESGRAWPLTAAEVRRIFPDGVMKSDPGLAKVEHGARFFDIAAQSIVKAIAKDIK